MTFESPNLTPSASAPSASAPAAKAEPGYPAPEPLVSPKRFFVRLSIAVLAVSFVTMVGLLYYFWLQRPVPASAMIVVVGDASFEGAVVRVVGSPSAPMTRTLAPENQYAVRIPVAPGMYTVEVTHGGRVARRDLSIGDNISATVDLRPAAGGVSPAGVGPHSRPDTAP